MYLCTYSFVVREFCKVDPLRTPGAAAAYGV